MYMYMYSSVYTHIKLYCIYSCMQCMCIYMHLYQMVKQGATTSWEMWLPLQGTHSHPWSTVCILPHYSFRISILCTCILCFRIPRDPRHPPFYLHTLSHLPAHLHKI